MYFLPFLLKNEKKWFFYPGDVSWEEKFNFDKIKIFNHFYIKGNFKELKKVIDYYPINFKEKVQEVFKYLKKPPKKFYVEDKSYDLNKLNIVGILNVTPDSFSDGGLYFSKEKAIEKGLKLVKEGADIIDIGGESTRPGSLPIPAEEEMERVIPVISVLSREIKVPISIDTTKSKVAEEAFKEGAKILNDISALHFDENMVNVIDKWKPSLILMHIKGKPEDMQRDTSYEHLPYDILSYLYEGIKKAESVGIGKEKILVDPGIGFGKDLNQNLWIINNLSFLRSLGCGILIGTSKKSFIGKILNLEPEERIFGTLSSNYMAYLRGASFIRVHNPKPHREFFKILEEINNAPVV